MVNLEAMYMKKLVVATNMGGPREIFDDGEDGILIEQQNPGLLARKISLLLENPELGREMGQKAHEALIGKFKISDTASLIVESYEKMCMK